MGLFTLLMVMLLIPQTTRDANASSTIILDIVVPIRRSRCRFSSTSRGSRAARWRDDPVLRDPFFAQLDHQHVHHDDVVLWLGASASS